MTLRETTPVPTPCDIEGLLAQVHEKVRRAEPLALLVYPDGFTPGDLAGQN